MGSTYLQMERLHATSRLTDMLFGHTQRTFSSLASMPSNVHAVDAALQLCKGANSLVAVVGPSGWGKSHLLDAVVHHLGQEPGEKVEVLTAANYLSGNRSEPGILVLDDVQEVLSKPKCRQLLRVGLERRVKAAKPTLVAFTMPTVTRQLKNFLPNAREWVVATMSAPEPSERVLLLNQMAKAEGLCLSPTLVRIIAIQMHGNGRTLAGAMKRLRLAGTMWLDARSTLKACGLLDAFFADNSAWDLKHKILSTAEASKGQFSKAGSLDIALYVMMHVANLSEARVARSAGIAPTEAYRRASWFSEQADTSPEIRGYVVQFVETVVSALAAE